MSEGAPAASTRPSATLVEMERELTRLLIEYDELETAWPNGRHVLVRAKIGRQATKPSYATGLSFAGMKLSTTWLMPSSGVNVSMRIPFVVATRISCSP